METTNLNTSRNISQQTKTTGKENKKTEYKSSINDIFDSESALNKDGDKVLDETITITKSYYDKSKQNDNLSDTEELLIKNLYDLKEVKTGYNDKGERIKEYTYEQNDLADYIGNFRGKIYENHLKFMDRDRDGEISQREIDLKESRMERRQRVRFGISINSASRDIRRNPELVYTSDDPKIDAALRDDIADIKEKYNKILNNDSLSSLEKYLKIEQLKEKEALLEKKLAYREHNGLGGTSEKEVEYMKSKASEYASKANRYAKTIERIYERTLKESSSRTINSLTNSLERYVERYEAANRMKAFYESQAEKLERKLNPPVYENNGMIKLLELLLQQLQTSFAW